MIVPPSTAIADTSTAMSTFLFGAGSSRLASSDADSTTSPDRTAASSSVALSGTHIAGCELRDWVGLENFVAVVVDHLDCDLTGCRCVERATTRPIERQPGFLVDLGLQCF